MNEFDSLPVVVPAMAILLLKRATKMSTIGGKWLWFIFDLNQFLFISTLIIAVDEQNSALFFCFLHTK